MNTLWHSEAPCWMEVRAAALSPTGPASPAHLVLDVVVAQLQLHDVLEGPEQRFVEVKVWRLGPAGQNLRQHVVDEGDGLLGDVTLLVARRLRDRMGGGAISNQDCNP